jgi:hypothetical protein
MSKKTIFSIFLICLLFLECKKNETTQSTENESKIYSLVLLSVGDVKSGNTILKEGSKVPLMDKIIVGKKSICDIQVVGSEAEINIRLKENSEFSLNQKLEQGKRKIQSNLQLGQILVKVNKLKQTEDFDVVSPVNVAGVRGTKFELSLDSKGVITTSVLEGSVAVKKRIPSLESIPLEVIEKTPSLKKLNDSINDEVIIPAGKVITNSSDETKSLLKTTGLDTLVTKLENDTKEKKDTQSLLKTASDAEQKIDTKKLEVLNTKPTPKDISSSDLEKKLKEYEEFITIEKEKLKDDASIKTDLNQKIAEKKETILKRLEIVLGKQSESLKLKNGEIIKGIIFEENDRYIVLTPEGKKEYTNEEIEGLAF